MPAISVLLPVRNALPYLHSSLASLWRQTFDDFEVIAVNDGSTDGSAEALERARAREPRLIVFHTPAQSLPAALNKALEHARAPLVARHDADDVSHRRRLELQWELLRSEPRVAVVGSRVRLFSAQTVGMGMRRWAAWHNALLTHEAMASEILIDSTLVHATAMIRRPWLDRVGGWADRRWAEDVDLWVRLLEAGARFAKLKNTLYGWRQHPGSATRRDPRYQRDRLLELKCDVLARGFLSRATSVTLVGVGTSLRAWQRLLGRSWRVRIIDAARPSTSLWDSLCPPIILIFGAEAARRRWRAALTGSGMIESEAFIFVA